MRNAAIRAASQIYTVSLEFEDETAVPGEQVLSAKNKSMRENEPQRWAIIEAALRKPAAPLVLINRFLPPKVQEMIRISEDLGEHEDIPLVCECRGQPPADRKAKELKAAVTIAEELGVILPRLAAIRSAIPADLSMLPYCLLSGASILAAQALHVQPGQRVLDLCAGPGAKSLMLATMLFAPSLGGKVGGDSEILAQAGFEAGVLTAPSNHDATASIAARILESGGRLVCNEPNKTRAALLEGILASFLPASLLTVGSNGAPAVAITRAEASEKAPLALQRQGPFDKVLVDPPCTMAHENIGKTAIGVERDLTTIKKHADLMEGLLRCAGGLVRPGGLIIYCTSSFEERENDDVIRRFLNRVGGAFEVEVGTEDAPLHGAELTKYGTMILPHQGTRYGPLYFAQLRRVQ